MFGLCMKVCRNCLASKKVLGGEQRLKAPLNTVRIGRIIILIWGKAVELQAILAKIIHINRRCCAATSISFSKLGRINIFQ